MSDRLLKPATVADRLAVSVDTLRYWRAQDRGPRFVRVGRSVRYRPEDVETWLVSQERAPQAIA